ncbi:SGNH/GDSL hydrolase family protein, partial [Ruminococcus flavefaciens]|uniref:SGNH/GDSL hydrolase family protein n=1 Tax=Ruminococcus flavefaciens TaxID=1265 RepID=UPI0026EFCED5
LIYSGYYVNTNGHCWANSLRDYLQSKFWCEVNNFGTTGRASGNLVQHMSDLVKDDDDIVICMIGTNDRNNETDAVSGQTRSISQFYANLNSIYNYVHSKGKEIIFMANIPASISNENSNKVFHMEDVDHTVMKLSANINIEYISVYKLFTEYCKYTNTEIDSLLADGLHPNDTGYDVMFYLICNALGFGTKRPDATW